MSASAASIHEHARFHETAGEKLGAEITELCAYIYAATHHLLELIREFDDKQYWAELGFKSCAHWLNFKCGFGMNSARERLRVAHALVELPKISAAFSEGKISYSKVRAVTRVADETTEDYLLMMCKHGTAHQVERLVAQYRRAKQHEDAGFAYEQHEKREVTYYYDADGSLVMNARMPADQGELIIKALEMAMDVPAVTPEAPEPVAARRADALAEVAETYLNNSENTGSTSDRYQVVVHVRAESSEIENGPCVSAVTSRRISCDCSTTTITECEHGEPLSIGRRSRTIPPAIRRMLRARDGGCRFPGCTSHRFVDGHHIVHWADGGETSVDNLVSLCRHHHILVHEGGFDCKRSKDGEIYFIDRRERRIEERAVMPGVMLEESLAWMYRKCAAADISGDTCVAKQYAGENIDYNHAVAVMFTPRAPGPR